MDRQLTAEQRAFREEVAKVEAIRAAQNEAPMPETCPQCGKLMTTGHTPHTETGE